MLYYILLLFVKVSFSTVYGELTCKPGFAVHRDYCFHVKAFGSPDGYGPISWTEANNYCQTLEQSAHLIVEKNKDTLMDLVHQHVSVHFNFGGPLRNCSQEDIMYDPTPSGSCARLTYSMSSFTGNDTQDMCVSYSDCNQYGILTSSQNFAICQYHETGFSSLCPSTWVTGPDGDSCFSFRHLINPSEIINPPASVKRTWNELYCEARAESVNASDGNNLLTASLGTFKNIMEIVWMQQYALPLLTSYDLGVGLRVGLTRETTDQLIWVDSSTRQMYLKDDPYLTDITGNLCATVIVSSLLSTYTELNAVVHYVKCSNPSTEPYVFSIRKNSKLDKSLSQYIEDHTVSQFCPKSTNATPKVCDDHGEKYCSCFQGFFGQECEQVMNYCDFPLVGSKIPITMDEICSKHGQCISTSDGAYCLCDEGFYGPLCTTVNSCSLVLNNHGCGLAELHDIPVPGKNLDKGCNNHGLSYCLCSTGFTGSNCENAINFCDMPIAMVGRMSTSNLSEICQPHGHCISSINGAHCQCDKGFTGLYCHTTIPDESFCGLKCGTSTTNLQNTCTHGQTCVFNHEKASNQSGGWCIPD